MIICATCSRKMKPIKIGVPVLEMTENDEPYKLWMADLLECPDCKITTLSIHDSQRPVHESYENTFTEKIASYDPKFFIR